MSLQMFKTSTILLCMFVMVWINTHQVNGGACRASADGTPCDKPCRGTICKASGGAKCKGGFCKRGPRHLCHPERGTPDGTPCNKKCNDEGCKENQGAKCAEGKCLRGPYTDGDGRLIDAFQGTYSTYDSTLRTLLQKQYLQFFIATGNFGNN